MIPSLYSYIFSMWSQLLLIISGVSWFTEWFYQSEWKNEVTQLWPTLCDPMDCSPPGSSIHGIFQASVDCHFLLQGIFLTQGLNPGLPHCRKMLYYLSHQSGFIFASFPFYASINLLTISFSLHFCGTTLPWLSSYMFIHFSLVSVFRLIFFSFSLMPISRGHLPYKWLGIKTLSDVLLWGNLNSGSIY